MMMKVLFVCTGNMCRSVAAEKLLLALGLPGVQARSRGTAAQPYGGMPREVRSFLERAGVADLQHKPAFISEADVDWADVILVMQNHHYEVLADNFPQSARKMHLFLEYCTGAAGAELQDPMGKGEKAFERVLGEVKAAVARLAEKQKQL